MFNRGVEKRTTFVDRADYERFLKICQWYLDPEPPISYSQRERLGKEIQHQIQHRVLDLSEGLVEVVAYCLMPNHFHFLVRVIKEQGLETWVRRTINSYTRSFNTRQNRIGPLFQGPYKIARIESNEQLVHVSRYIHLNSVVARLCTRAEKYPYSSMGLYLRTEQSNWVNPSVIVGQFASPSEYLTFVADHASYAIELNRIKHLLLEDQE